MTLLIGLSNEIDLHYLVTAILVGVTAGILAHLLIGGEPPRAS